MIQDDDRYSLAEAAALIHKDVEPATLQRAVYDGKLEVIRIGSVTLVSGEALKRYIKGSTKPCHGRTQGRNSRSTDPTQNTAPKPRKVSANISGTSLGRSAAGAMSPQRAHALKIADRLKHGSPTSSPAGPSDGTERVVPIRS